MIDYDDNANDSVIAVVGLAGRFPGAADLDGFWANLAAGRETVTRLASDPLSRRTPAYAMVESAGDFDAAFFGYSPREALILDPQHRVFLECAWEALEHAGCDPTSFPGLIGVYGGSGDTGHYGTLRAHRAELGMSDWQLRLASGADFLTSRVTYKLGLTGPAVTVQTACSTSLVAVHIASQALLAGDCDLALAGGVTVRVPNPMDEAADDGVLSADGRVRSFDAAASGTVAGDGAGVVALKRLSDALADGDRVYAVLRGSAVNNDGAGKIGFAAPSVDGQAAAIRAAHLAADVDPTTIGFVEAHGTGTPVGDPIEVRALTKAFEAGMAEDAATAGVMPSRTGFAVLGSAKTNIGHTDAAAGVIGLIKTVLVLTHEVIPPTVHFETANPLLELEASPFVVTNEARAWPRSTSPRRAGVNSLGIGGTNAHVVVEEAPLPAPHQPGRPYQLLPVSARTSEAVGHLARRLGDHLATAADPLEDIAWTLQTGRRAFAHRAFVVAESPTEARSALASASAVKAPERAARAAFLFPGQGGQHVGMARELYDSEPVFRAEIDHVAELAAPGLGLDLREIIFPAVGEETRAAEQLTAMRISQPVLFAVEYALARQWQAWGVTPEVVLGHSLGAYAAATIAGVLSLADAVALVLHRSELLDSLPAGSMLAVSMPAGTLSARLGALSSIAAVNGPTQCVVTGPAAEVSTLATELTAEGVEVRPLFISAAAHSVFVDAVMIDFERRVAEVRLNPPAIPWISDRTGKLITDEEATDPAYWSAHLRHTVQFSAALDSLFELPDLALIEIGPGRTLGTLARRHPGYQATVAVIAGLPHPAEPTDDAVFALTAVGRAWQAGVMIDWAALQGEAQRYRVPLPTYPFERQRYVLEPVAETDVAHRGNGALIMEFERPELEQQFVEASTETELAVAAAFGDVLGMREVGVHDDFFDLGGDSLVATRLLSSIRESVGANLSVRDLFAAPTVTELAELIDLELAA